jgi:hypothetical protein
VSSPAASFLPAADARAMSSLFASVWPNTHPIFYTNSCRITVEQTEIQCKAPEGFGGPLQWSVYLLGVTAAPYQTDKSVMYSDPVLDAVAVITVNTTTVTNNSVTILRTITSVYDAMSAGQAPIPGALSMDVAPFSRVFYSRVSCCVEIQNRTRPAASELGRSMARTWQRRTHTT